MRVRAGKVEHAGSHLDEASHPAHGTGKDVAAGLIEGQRAVVGHGTGKPPAGGPVPTCSTPELIVVPPVCVLLPVRTSVPGPDMCKVEGPLSDWASVNWWRRWRC